MKFTRKTDYALRAMEFLARKQVLANQVGGSPQPVAVQTIAEACHLSVRFLQGIVSQLGKSGLVKTISGPKGGIALAKALDKTTILEIIEAVEGRIQLMECLEHPHQCADAKACSIMSILHGAQNAMVQVLKTTHLGLMVGAKIDPFHPLPQEHFLKPKFGCPVLK